MAETILSKEQVAFRALELIADVEKVDLYGGGQDGKRPATRAWILHTLADCVNALSGTIPSGTRLATAEEWLVRSK